jgi:hypothetical protein
LSSAQNKLSEQALICTDSSLALSRENAETELRAYVNFNGVKKHSFVVGEKIDFSVDFHNAGKTPANNIQIFIDVKTGTGVYPVEQAKVDSIVKTQPRSTLGANQTIHTSLKPEIAFVFRRNDSLYISQEKSTMFVFGKTIYQDIFGKDHYTRFCYYLSSRTKSFYIYKKYNDSD